MLVSKTMVNCLVSHKITPTEVVQRLRLNILANSYIYYVLGGGVISDTHWQQMANTLRMLHAVYGFTWECYDEAFADWDGSTGMHLPCDAVVKAKAEYLLAR